MLATSRRFVALLAARMKARVETRLTTLIQIDGFHMDEDMLFVAGMARRERRQTSVRPRRRRFHRSRQTSQLSRRMVDGPLG